MKICSNTRQYGIGFTNLIHVLCSSRNTVRQGPILYWFKHWQSPCSCSWQNLWVDREVSSSSSDDELKMDVHLENYLTNSNVETLNSQGMARMKQTVRKQNTISCGPPPAVVNPSNKLDLDSSLERAYNAINNDDPDMGSKGPGAASHSSPWRGGSSGLNLDGGGAGGSGGSGRGQRPKWQIKSESSEEEEPTSSEESSEEEPPRKWPKKSDKSPGKQPRKQLVAKPPRKANHTNGRKTCRPKN